MGKNNFKYFNSKIGYAIVAYCLLNSIFYKTSFACIDTCLVKNKTAKTGKGDSVGGLYNGTGPVSCDTKKEVVDNAATNSLSVVVKTDVPIKKNEAVEPNNPLGTKKEIIDLSDIINTAIGAIFGFGSALYIEYLLIKRKRQESIENIVLELRDIRNTLAELKDNNVIPSIFGYAISVPIWKTVIANGDILELKNKPYYNHLFFVYSNVLKLQKMEDWFYENHFLLGKKKCEDSMKDIINQRNEVYSLLSTPNSLTELL